MLSQHKTIFLRLNNIPLKWIYCVWFHYTSANGHLVLPLGVVKRAVEDTKKIYLLVPMYRGIRRSYGILKILKNHQITF